MKRIQFIKAVSMSGLGITLFSKFILPNLSDVNFRVIPLPDFISHVRHGKLESKHIAKSNKLFASVISRETMMANGHEVSSQDLLMFTFSYFDSSYDFSMLADRFTIVKDGQLFLRGRVEELHHGIPLGGIGKMHLLGKEQQLLVTSSQNIMVAALLGDAAINGNELRSGFAHYARGEDLKLEAESWTLVVKQAL